MAPQAMPKRAWVRQERGALRPRALGRRKDSGTRTSSRTSSLVTEARRDILRFTSRAWKPGVSVGTRKPRTSPPSSLAQITARWARLPLVIHILVPFRTQVSPSRLARVFMLP